MPTRNAVQHSFHWVAFALAMSTAAGAATVARTEAERREILARFLIDVPTTQAALAPDGAYLAYNVGNGVRILDLNRPGRVATGPEVAIETERTQRDWLRQEVPAPAIELLWADERRLVYAGQFEARAVNADGTAAISLGTVDRVVGQRIFFPQLWLRMRRIAGRPESVILTAAGMVEKAAARSVSLGVLQVNVSTGAGESFQSVPGALDSWVDWQGRIQIWRSAEDYFIRRISTEDGKSTLRWQSLAQMTGQDDFKTGSRFTYERRAVPLGFDRNPAVFYYATNVGRAAYAIRMVDLRTGKDQLLADDEAGRDLVDPLREPESALIFDRQGRLVGIRRPGVPARVEWLEPWLARAQSRVDGRFPGETVAIVDWDDAHARLLLRVSAHEVPGRFVVQELDAGRIVAEVPCAPQLPDNVVGPVTAFSFTNSGDRVEGILTMPAQSRLKRAPLVLYVHDAANVSARGGFDPFVQSLAALGYAVAEVDYHGSAGHGNGFRNDLLGGDPGLPVADLLAAVRWLGANREVTTERTLLIGEGFGGYISLRALQLHPEVFHGAVTINAPADPQAWYVTSVLWGGELTRRAGGFLGAVPQAVSVLEDARLLSKPVLYIYGTERESVPGDLASQSLALRRSRMADADPFQTLRIPRWESWRWQEWRKVYESAADFLDENAYEYTASIGNLKVLGN